MALAATCLWDSLDTLKTWLKQPRDEVRHQALLESLANAATEEIERKTGRVFVTRSISEVLHGDGTTLLTLRGYPVSAITSLTLAGVAITADLYTLDADAGLIWRTDGGRWTDGLANVAIAYTAGYARADLPASVLRIGAEMVKLWFDEWNAGAIAVSSLNIGAAGMVIKPAWPYHVKEALEELRLEVRVPL